ncbi:hypothetical protein [Pseudomonas sp. PNPG3]|uniref:hypothetical protein n=1 Tax=Pseudomonas sp. PNPG3 TaxID=2919497 RepID=UPI001FFD794B|nr:hypothetical protein [Pseudomonas sp. PNPG3]MCK2122136.1 hypothetical protein [Pseudomonas sp. PNPG3]
MDSIEKALEVPAQFEQRTATEVLRGIIEPIERAGAIDDPRMWSVNERMFVIASYMSATRDDGPDFPIGEGKFSDYLLDATDYVAEVPFHCDGRDLIYTPLHGYQAEIIETLLAGGNYSNTSYSWWKACMAACVRGADEEPLQYQDDGQYETLLVERIEAIGKLGDSDFVELFDAYQLAAQSGAHMVYAITNLHGVLAAQVSEPPEGVPVLAPARFPSRSAISKRAREIMGVL